MQATTPFASSRAAAEAMLGWEARRRGTSVALLRLFNAASRSEPDSARIAPRGNPLGAAVSERSCILTTRLALTGKVRYRFGQ